MTTNVTPIVSNEETAVRDYAVRIKAQITTAATAWKEIARLFAQAANEFGLKSDAMKSLLKQTNFSESKAVKLITIANSERLQKHEETFKCVDAWTVLYAITSLADDEFERLLGKVDDETVITQSVVNSAKTKIEREIDDYETVFTIKISSTALKAGEFDEYSELQDAVQNIQDTIKYVRVDETKIFENDASRFYNEVVNKFQSLATALVNAEMKKYRTTNREYFKKFANYGVFDKDEMNELKREGRFVEALDAMGVADAFDEHALYNEAQNLVVKAREEKFKERLKNISAFAFANTEIQVAA